MKQVLLTLVLSGWFAASANATDRYVDASGSAGRFTTIDQAMTISAPGDRILVYPGTYPAFHFSRGVEVLGLGARPGDVVIARVDFHVTIPIIDFSAGLENVAIASSNLADAISLGGNELSRGVIVVDSVEMSGGVFLHGSGGLYLMLLNSSVDPGPGGGFLNAAVDFGGGTADIVDTRVRAAAGSQALGLPAGLALRVSPGSTVRVSGSQVLGGHGDEGAQARDGGAAIQGPANGNPGVQLRISGGSVVHGGAAWRNGTGGSGVDVVGVILTGNASVQSGAGSNPSPAYASSQPTALAYEPRLSIAPSNTFAQGDAFLHPGDSYTLLVDASLPTPSVGWTTVLTASLGADCSPMAQGRIHVVPDPSLGILVPGARHQGSNPAPQRRRYYQAFFTDPTSGLPTSTNPVAVTIDP